MYARILVPIDGSQAAMAGLEEAIKLCQAPSARLRLLHVVNEMIVTSPFAAGTFDPIVFSTAMVEKLRKDAQALLDKAGSIAKHRGVQVECTLLEAIGHSAGAEIVRQAHEWPADIIVMGTHGRRGIRRIVLGSDAELVVRMAPVPVLLVRSTDHGPAATEADSAHQATT